jgi:hypothetical protein
MLYCPYIKRLVKDPVLMGRVKLFECKIPLLPRFTVSLPWHLPNAARNVHLHCIGLSNSGKSKFVEGLFVSDVLAGRGCCLIDPDEDLAYDTIRHLMTLGYFHDGNNKHPHARLAAYERIIYFEPARKEYCIPFNILNNPGFEPDALAGHVTEAFKRAWTSIKEGPRFLAVAQPAILLLVEAGMTLPDLYLLLEDAEFRAQVLARSKNRGLVKQFLREFEIWNETQAINNESVTNKLTDHVFSPPVRSCMGVSANHINARHIMDSGKVLIVNLRGLSEQVQRLFGSLLTILFEQAALDRPQHARRPFYYHLDEFQDYCAGEGAAVTLSKLLSRARKRNFYLHLYHQSLGQLHGHIMDALGNVALNVAFQVSYPDAQALIHIFKVRSENWAEDIAHMQDLLPRHAWVKQRHKSLCEIVSASIPSYTTTPQQLEEVIQNLERKHGMPAPVFRPTEPTSATAPRMPPPVPKRF